KKQLAKQMQKDMYSEFQFTNYIDSAWPKQSARDAVSVKTVKDFDELIPDTLKISINQGAQGLFSTLRIRNDSFESTMKDQDRNLRKHKIEWHRKISLSLACLVLFLVGAPLGSIIRKGGLGTPLIFAIIAFMIFYFSSTTGEKFAKENTLSVFAGMWLATFVLLPVGIFLTYKAMRDSQLFNKEFYNRIVKRLSRKKDQI
ncbi:MAG: LptF/LptG family permease, partial [Bacteroidia bacterium]|nr:LptF/LptG family permease [Bacteroidia bacterium]